MAVTQEQEVAIFRRLAIKSAYEVGLEFGFEKMYKDAQAIRNAVQGIYKKVSRQPERYEITPEIIQVVKDAMAHRSLVRVQSTPLAEKEIESADIKTLVTGVRDKAWRLMDRKLSRASKSNKKLDSVGFRELATMAGIAFDKSQIILGQATENVALMGKIEGNINPQDALDLVLKMREATVASKQK